MKLYLLTFKHLLSMKYLLSLLLFISIQANAQTIIESQVMQQIACNGNNDGSVWVAAYPLGQYQYTATNGSTSITNTHGWFTTLGKGMWVFSAINICDPLEVITPVYQTLEEPPLLEVSEYINASPSYCDCAGGVVSLNISGGTTIIQPYNTYWTNLDNNLQINSDNYSTYEWGLIAGHYQVVIEDDLGCHATKYFTLINE
jgi:hypothetical protein